MTDNYNPSSEEYDAFWDEPTDEYNPVALEFMLYINDRVRNAVKDMKVRVTYQPFDIELIGIKMNVQGLKNLKITKKYSLAKR